MISEPESGLAPDSWIVVELTDRILNGEIASTMRDVMQRELDPLPTLIVLRKGEDGSLEQVDLSPFDNSLMDEVRPPENRMVMVVSDADVTTVAAEMEPGSSAAMLIWERTRAARFESAMPRSDGRLVGIGDSPIQAMLAAIEEDEDA